MDKTTGNLFESVPAASQEGAALESEDSQEPASTEPLQGPERAEEAAAPSPGEPSGNAPDEEASNRMNAPLKDMAPRRPPLRVALPPAEPESHMPPQIHPAPAAPPPPPPPKNTRPAQANNEESDAHIATRQPPPPSPSAASAASTAPDGPSMHQVIFDDMIAQHRLWLETEGKEGRRANLAHTAFAGLDFEGVTLEQANLRGADFTGCDLRDVPLQDADMREAILDGVQASGCDWSRVVLSAASLREAMLDGAGLHKVDAMNADFTGASLRECLLSQWNGRDAVLRGADLTGAVMHRAACRGIDATDTVFAHADMAYADMRSATCVRSDFSYTNLEGVSFKDAYFEDVPFSVTDFSVAVDIPVEAQNQGMQLEKAYLEQEREELRHMQEEVDRAREDVQELRSRLDKQGSLIRSLQGDEDAYVSGLRKISRRLRHVRIFWSVCTLSVLLATVAVVTSLSLESLKWLELGVVLVTPVLIMLMLFFTISQISLALSRIEHHASIRELKVRALQEETSQLPPTQEDPASKGSA